MKVWMVILKTLLLNGCVIMGSLVFCSAMVGAILMDLYDYISRLVGGKNIGGFSESMTIGLLDRLGTLWPIFALSGFCIGIMMAWGKYKDFSSRETKRPDKLN